MSLNEIMQAMSKQHYPQVETLLTQALAAPLVPVDIYECAFLFYSRMGQPEKATHLLEKALEIYPDSAALWNHQGNLFYRKKAYEAALDAYLKSLAAEAESGQAASNAALCYVQLGDHEKAQLYFEQALRFLPDHVISLFNLGLLYRGNKGHQKALYCFSRYTELQPNHYEGYYHLAIVNLEMRRHEDAEGYFLKALELAPDLVELNFDYAALLHQLHRKEEALVYYQRVLKIDPSHEAAQFMVAALQGKQGIEKAPASFMQLLFNQYAPHYNHHLEKILKYEVPSAIGNLMGTRYENKKIKIADLGCGTGLCGPHLKPYAETLIGIDISESMLAQAKKQNLYDKLIAGDLCETLDHLQYHFDLMVAADVFIYFGNLAPVFECVHTWLAPAGRFIFTLEKGEAEDYHLLPSGRFKHSITYIQNLASKIGFNVVTIKEHVTRHQDNSPVEGLLVELLRN